jgi:hypothetical protein
MDTGNETVMTKILVEDSRGVFRGQVGQDDIYDGAHVYGFRVVPGRFFDDLCEMEGIYHRLKDSRGAKHVPV